MNKLFKRAACLAVTAAMTLSSSGALACTGYYVGKQASASGIPLSATPSMRGTPRRRSRSSIRTARNRGAP